MKEQPDCGSVQAIRVFGTTPGIIRVLDNVVLREDLKRRARTESARLNAVRGRKSIVQIPFEILGTHN
jgi:hypothetical protein